MAISLRLQDHRGLLRIAFLVCCFFAFAYFLAQPRLPPRAWEAVRPQSLAYQPERPMKPENITVSGLVFYGRKSRASCLRCYIEVGTNKQFKHDVDILQRNLVHNGGWLDEVLWIVNTDDEDDLLYLDEITARDPTRHKKITPEGHLGTHSYWKAWRHLERGKYYVKIDDDVLWIEDGAIPEIISYKISNPHTFVVSGNIINNPPLGFIHYHMGALHPYLPELEESEHVANGRDFWRPSKHGFWTGPGEISWDLSRPPPDHPNSRWLRVADAQMWQTPAHQLTYDVWGDSYRSWAIAAQMHYSLLENIENDSLHLYKFNRPWTMHGDRIRINFMCVYADDILDTEVENWPAERGDEDMIVLDLPKKLKRPVVVLGTALASHFQYTDQPDLSKTDLLLRYQSLAQDRACGGESGEG